MKVDSTAANLAEYFSIINTANLGSCISRGEPADYDDTALCASALRCIANGAFFDEKRMIQKVNAFYSEICMDLLPIQKEHFLAFAQHHCINTCLLDFTKSPLVSLFFACMNSHESESGYVHFISKDRLISITDQMNDTSLISQLSFFYEFSLIEERFSDIYHLLAFSSKSTKMLAHYVQANFHLIENITAEVISDEFQQFLLFSRAPFLNVGIDSIEEALDCIRHKEDGSMILGCLYAYLSIVIAFREQIYGTDIEEFFPLIFTYTPPVIVNRVRNQSSILVYQYGESSLPMIQKITQDYVIGISDKKQIMKELDQININRKSIFYDYDNIARYIQHSE